MFSVKIRATETITTPSAIFQKKTFRAFSTVCGDLKPITLGASQRNRNRSRISELPSNRYISRIHAIFGIICIETEVAIFETAAIVAIIAIFHHGGDTIQRRTRN